MFFLLATVPNFPKEDHLILNFGAFSELILNKPVGLSAMRQSLQIYPRRDHGTEVDFQ